MAKKVGYPQNLYVAGYDLSGDAGAINEQGSSRTTYDVPGLDSSGMQRVTRRADGHLEWLTWFNDAPGQEHVALSGLPTADVLLAWTLGITIGDAALMLTAKQLNYDWAEQPDGALAGTVRAEQNAVAPEWGRLLTAGMRTDTAATNGTSYDNGAATASGLAAMVQCVAFTGTSVTVAIQESSDNGGADAWTTILSFTAISAANQSERKTLSGAIEQYLRVITTGTFTNAKFAVVVRRGTADDDESY